MAVGPPAPPRPSGGLSGDLLAAMSAAPAVLVVACCGGSVLFVSAELATLFSSVWALPESSAGLAAAAVAVLYVLVVLTRMLAPGLGRSGLCVVVSATVVVVWVSAVVDAGLPLPVAGLAAGWAMLGTWTVVRLVVDRRGSTRHALYRFYGRDRRLLYVGRTRQRSAARFGQHAAEKAWIGQVANREVTFYPTHTALVAAETAAIRSERPLYNKVHNGRPRRPRRRVRARGGRR